MSPTPFRFSYSPTPENLDLWFLVAATVGGFVGLIFGFGLGVAL
jgi:hypothetical protein